MERIRQIFKLSETTLHIYPDTSKSLIMFVLSSSSAHSVSDLPTRIIPDSLLCEIILFYLLLQNYKLKVF